MNAKWLKQGVFVTVLFYTWGFGGIAGLANAIKAAHAMEQRSALTRAKGTSAEQHFEQTVIKIEQILADSETDVQAKREALKRQGAKIKALDKEIRRSFAETEAHFKKSRLPERILQRHLDFVQEYEEYLEVVHYDLDSLEPSDSFFKNIGKKIDKRRIARMRERIRIQKSGAAKKIRPFDPENLPFNNRRLKPKAPRLTKEAFECDLTPLETSAKPEDRPKRIARDAVLDALVPPVQAASLPPVAADLAENIEIKFTPDIVAKAAELDYDPVKIYNWVRNNVEFVPTWGSIQGAQYCLETLQGNAFDTASLLIALLRASNIPARYVMGTVEIPIDQVMNWVGGFTDPQAALDFIASGGIPVKALLENPNGVIDPGQVGVIGGTPVEPDTPGFQIKYAQMEHVWVEAFIDYVPSRGGRHHNGRGDTWIEMDASFKRYAYTEGVDIQAAVPFDAQAFIDQLTASATINEQEGYVTGIDGDLVQTALENYKNTLQDYLDQNHPEATVGDVLGEKRTVVADFTYLVGTLPYKKAVVGTHVSDLPDNLRHKLSFEIAKDEFDTAQIQVTKSLPELAGKKITISYNPATPADEAVIKSYLPEQHADGTPIQPDELPQSLPAYSIHVVPELRIGGKLISTGGAVTLGTEEVFTMQFYDPAENPRLIVNTIQAGEYFAVGINAGSSSSGQVDQLRMRIEEAKDYLETRQPKNREKETVLGEIFFATAMLYHAAVDINRYIIGRAIGAISTNLPSVTIFGLQLAVDYQWGIPRTIGAGSLFLDADHLSCIVKAIDGNLEKQRIFMFQSGVASSAFEHSIPEKLFSNAETAIEGISAVKALQIANSQGVPIYTVNEHNIYDVIPVLRVDIKVKQEIQNAVVSGKEVIVSKTNIDFNGWVGCGYIISDNVTGEGAYLISGGLNGGFIILLLGSLWFLWALGMGLAGWIMLPFAIGFFYQGIKMCTEDYTFNDVLDFFAGVVTLMGVGILVSAFLFGLFAPQLVIAGGILTLISAFLWIVTQFFTSYNDVYQIIRFSNKIAICRRCSINYTLA